MMKVQSVLGEIDVASLGVTLTHEHFNLEFDKCYVQPPEQLARFLQGEISLRNSGFVRQYPYSNHRNMKLQGVDVDEAVVKEMRWFKESGGGTVLENTTHGLGRNVELMKMVMETTGVNVILGTGHYVAAMQESSTLNQTEEMLYSTMCQDLLGGCPEDATVKCGFIGEVGSSWPIHDFEMRCIRATAALQSELNCAVSFHPGRHSKAPWEIMRIYTEAGGKVNKADMSHLDRTLNKEELLEFANLGTYCQLDLFGVETSLYQLNAEVEMPSDAERINRIQALIDESKSDRILISHDIHTRHRLINFGGHGYSHIINNVVPQMERKGFEKSVIEQITIKNPAEWLSSKPHGG